jgi:putative DNA primase/helicase
MQRLAGYCLTGDTREEQWWLKYGSTLGGKTTWTSSLQETWGDYAIAVDFQTFAIQKIESSAPREDIARLHGPRLVVSSEVRKGVRISEGLIKQLTGGDRLTAHRKYEHQFDFVPRCKLMVAANYRPQVRDDDSAIWRRIVEVPFTQSIPNPDPAIKATLTDPSKAGPAILAWAVQGATDWFAGGLQRPNAIKESTAAYRAAMNPLADFFRERCVFEKRATVRAG